MFRGESTQEMISQSYYSTTYIPRLLSIAELILPDRFFVHPNIVWFDTWMFPNHIWFDIWVVPNHVWFDTDCSRITHDLTRVFPNHVWFDTSECSWIMFDLTPECSRIVYDLTPECSRIMYYLTSECSWIMFEMAPECSGICLIWHTWVFRNNVWYDTWV